MAEHLLCPGCRKEPFILEAETHAYTLLECSECSFQAQESDWNQRVPGPATKEMLAWAKRTEESLESHDANHPLVQIFRAFLAEWPEPDAKGGA